MTKAVSSWYAFFFFNDTATTEIYTLSLHDALPIFGLASASLGFAVVLGFFLALGRVSRLRDRKSTRLNSSHLVISYAVFCLKKKKRRATLTVPSVPGTTEYAGPVAPFQPNNPPAQP